MKLISREVLIYLCLFVATTFINKYVLSILRFTYPTIFQGWQTLVGAVLLRILIQTGKVNIDLTSLSRTTIAPWLPAMMLFLVTIYSGSVALAKLSVPVYLSLTNIVYIFVATGEVVGTGHIITARRYILLMLLLVTVILISWTDPQYDPIGYFWICVHIVSLGLISVYEIFAKYRIHLGELDKMYLNYIYSLTVLVPCTYFLGDAMAAKHFQFWFYYKFYAGCVLSGICGVFLTLYKVQCQEVSYNVEEVTCSAKILASLVSMFVFPYRMTVSNTIWIMINLMAGVLLHEEDIAPDRTSPHPLGRIEKEAVSTQQPPTESRGLPPSKSAENLV